jgi:hypothetical protein
MFLFLGESLAMVSEYRVWGEGAFALKLSGGKPDKSSRYVPGYSWYYAESPAAASDSSDAIEGDPA